jgi:hypothetical protein
MHARLGHVNAVDMHKAVSLVDGIAYTGKVSSPCVSCTMAKQSRDALPKQSETLTTKLLELVHCDIVGPFPVNGLNGERYMVIFKDDFSSMTFVTLLRSRDEVLRAFTDWKLFVENQTGETIKTFRSDGALEFQSFSFSRVLAESGIARQVSAPYTQGQDGKAERSVRTITECGRSMLQHASLPKAFWSVAMQHAAYIRNRLPCIGWLDSL